MNTPLNPTNVHPPGVYSHTVAVPGDARWLAISGQVGVDPKGKLASGIERQAERAFRNVVACLRANKMKPADLVKLTVFVTDPRFIPAYRAARHKVLGDDVVPASTLLVVSGLATPEMLIEIEAWAAAS
ncbi:MAG: RidA family protein [Gammaproteobacteria bacterium]|nr:RidA family protein [Gammaproteobacteria bacterium]